MLVELLAVIACLTVILGVSMMLLFQTFEYQIRHNERTDQNRIANRLIEQFRIDVRGISSEPQIAPEENVFIQWNLPQDQIIRYELHEGKFPENCVVVRSLYVLKDGEREILATERYQLPDHTQLRFVKGENEFQGLTALCFWIGVAEAASLDVSQLDPFTRTIAPASPDVPVSRLPSIDPKYAANWRTVIVRSAQN